MRGEQMDIETAGQLMGMKPHREVREVVAVDGGHKVLTHDGQWTLIDADGTVVGATTAPEADTYVVEVDPGEPDLDEDEFAVSMSALVALVPDGTKDEVLAWVGDDPGKAAAALEVERGRESPRSTLVAALEKVAG